MAVAGRTLMMSQNYKSKESTSYIKSMMGNPAFVYHEPDVDRSSIIKLDRLKAKINGSSRCSRLVDQ